MVTREEIHRAIRCMGGFKAPGPNGFQAIFYQTQWNIVGGDFCNLIMDIFNDPRRVEEINNMLITLIPKVESVLKLKDFRPISLCNVSYKTITKIIALRLKGIIEQLVGPCQCSFIPNRHSSDNIVIAQEVFHTMKNKKGKKGWMAIKVDLEKAYDRLNLNFIRDTLIEIGCPDDIVSLIWICISSISMRVLWNGEALDAFSLMRGIRQGDPISPYLFVLCIERLFYLINLAVDNKFWKHIWLVRGDPMLSHLAFVDDLILFAEASMDQVEVIQTILDLFLQKLG